MPQLQIQLPESLQALVNDDAFSSYLSGTTDPAAGATLGKLSPSDLFESKITDRELAKCCLSGMWLLQNFLDDSHAISQSIHSAEGSFWHAIMHRIEGDFSNSKYWYRQVGSHPAISDVAQTTGAEFDPFEFVDRCQQESRSGKLSSETHDIAVAEWTALFEYCYENAS